MIKIQQLGYGKFTATNGHDIVAAEFERGKKGEDKKFHPCWNLTYNGRITSRHETDKDGITEIVNQMLMAPGNNPITDQEAQDQLLHDGCVHGIVSVSLDELQAAPLDPKALLTRVCVTAADYKVVSLCVVGMSDEGRDLFFRVAGVPAAETGD